MFKKGPLTIIAQEFSFLTNYGFTFEKYQKAHEIETVYIKGQKQIVIIHDIVRNDLGHKISIIEVILEGFGESKNLLNCHQLFGEEKLNHLKTQLINKDYLEQIAIYAEFIKNNLEKLKILQ